MADHDDPEVSLRVSQRYRELGAPEPPRELDRSILDAARHATDRPHAPLVTPAGRHRWYFSLAAAAILVMAVAITWQIERVQPDVETVTGVLKEETPPEKPASPPASPREFASEPKPRDQEVPATPERKVAPQPKRQVQQAAPEAARDAAAAASSPAESRMRENAPGDVARAEAPRAPAPAAAPSDRFERRADVNRTEPQAAPPGSRSKARVMGQLAAEPPERWLERIAELRKEGKHDEADKSLAEFRKQYPDYRISESMLEKVEKR